MRFVLVLMRKFLKAFILLLVFAIVWELAGVFEYVKQSAEFNTNKEIPQNIDMVVALTGGAKRLPEAFKIMQNINAKHLLISGVDQKVTFETLATAYNWDASLKSKVLLDYASQTTYDNARITSSFVKDFGVKQMVLVTSVYHMKRAYSLFNEELKNTGIELNTYSVYTKPIDALNWWREKGALLLLVEYLKFEEHKLVQRLF